MQTSRQVEAGEPRQVEADPGGGELPGAGVGRGGEFATVGDLPGVWVEVFSGYFGFEGSSVVLMDWYGGRLEHRVRPWWSDLPDPGEVPHDKQYGSDVWVVLEFLDGAGAVVASVPGWVYPDSGGSYSFDVVASDLPEYSSYRALVGSEVLAEFERAASVPDFEVAEVTSPRSASGPLVGDLELVLRSSDPDRLVSGFHHEVYYSDDGGDTYTQRAKVASAPAGPNGVIFTAITGPGRVTLPIRRSFGPSYNARKEEREYRHNRRALSPQGTTRARFMVVFSDGGRWAAAESPVVALGAALSSPVVDAHSFGTIRHERLFRHGDTIPLVATVTDLEDGVFEAVNCFAGEALSWTSDIDGSLDSFIEPSQEVCGPDLLDASLLSVGDHNITTSVTDSHGLTATTDLQGSWDPIQVTVVEADTTIVAFDDTTNMSFPASGEDHRVCADVLFHDAALSPADAPYRWRSHWRYLLNVAGSFDPASLAVIEAPSFGSAAPERVDGEWCIQYTLTDLDAVTHSRDPDQSTASDYLTYQVCDTGPEPKCSSAQLEIVIWFDEPEE